MVSSNNELLAMHSVYDTTCAVFMTQGILGNTCGNSRYCDGILDMVVIAYRVPVCSHACPQCCMYVSCLLLHQDVKPKGSA